MWSVEPIGYPVRSREGTGLRASPDRPTRPTRGAATSPRPSSAPQPPLLHDELRYAEVFEPGVGVAVAVRGQVHPESVAGGAVEVSVDDRGDLVAELGRAVDVQV